MKLSLPAGQYLLEIEVTSPIYEKSTEVGIVSATSGEIVKDNYGDLGPRFDTATFNTKNTDFWKIFYNKLLVFNRRFRVLLLTTNRTLLQRPL